VSEKLIAQLTDMPIYLSSAPSVCHSGHQVPLRKSTSSSWPALQVSDRRKRLYSTTGATDFHAATGANAFIRSKASSKANPGSEGIQSKSWLRRDPKPILAPKGSKANPGSKGIQSKSWLPREPKGSRDPGKSWGSQPDKRYKAPFLTEALGGIPGATRWPAVSNGPLYLLSGRDPQDFLGSLDPGWLQRGILAPKRSQRASCLQREPQRGSWLPGDPKGDPGSKGIPPGVESPG